MPLSGDLIKGNVAFMADIHGNAIALRACLKYLEARRIERIFFLGDAVGYLPAAREVLQLLREAGCVCQQGNHEAMLLSGRPAKEAYRHEQARRQLSPADLEWIASWPSQRELCLSDRNAMLVHGSPADPLTGYVYSDTDLAQFSVDHDWILMGHTHRPFVRPWKQSTFVNVGSVGLPRDQGNLASLAIYNRVTDRIAIERVPFDIDEVVAEYGSGIDTSVVECLQRNQLQGAGTHDAHE